MFTDVLIIGGGLSGLHTARELHKLNFKFVLAEARNRLGGRILSHNENNTAYSPDRSTLDLGPTWFWPGQSYMQTLLNTLDMDDEVFMQTSAGDSLYEDAQGNVRRGADGISMAGAYRMKGGMQQIISALNQQIPDESLIINATVTCINQQKDYIVSTVQTDKKSIAISSKSVVLALPPRVALASIQFLPGFSDTRRKELDSIATWMAGHAKLVSVYDHPFWQELGLSGDAVSHRGPLQEIHDASAHDSAPYALFGFVGIPPRLRREQKEKIQDAAIAQLKRLFGAKAAAPLDIYFKDWAFDPHTATEQDQEILRFHPQNNIVNVTEDSWRHHLIWSGTESADIRFYNNGFLEGALEASHRTISLLTSQA